MNTKKWNKIWTNATLATCEAGYGLIEHASIAVKNGNIVWLGEMSTLTDDPAKLADEVIDVNGRCITPGLIDCHTHLIYAGNRAKEFEMRLQGMTYEEIAKKGGGIQSTVSATRDTSEDELFTQSLQRAEEIMKSGATTIEIKSGYGLDWKTEEKMLRVADRIEKTLPLTIRKTFLGAHTVPPEYQGKADEYVNYVCEDMIPKIAQEKLADSVDVFCEKIAFSIEQTEKIFQAAKKYKLNIKCHAEQLSDSGSAALAANYKALSADHLEHVSAAGVEAMAKAGTVAVLLPGAFYFLHETELPPVPFLRKSNVPIAIATDCNPGTSPVTSLLLMLNMACTLFRLTPEEALLGVTKHAAKALGLEKSVGTLTVGKQADLAVWNISHPAELAYYIGGNPLYVLVKKGAEIIPHKQNRDC